MGPDAFGAKLRELREAKGLSQQQLADAAGVSQNGLSKWERGDREPGWSIVVALAGALGVDCKAFEAPPAAGVKPPGRGRPKKPAAGGAKKRKKGA